MAQMTHDRDVAWSAFVAKLSNRLGIGLGDRWRAPQGLAGRLKDQFKKPRGVAWIHEKQGGKSDSFDPPPNGSASMVRNAMKKGLPG